MIVETRTAVLIALLAPLMATAQSPLQPQAQQPSDAERRSPAALVAAPLSMRLGFETVSLPGNEALGLVGGTLLLQAAPGWWVGPAAYGAASGRRGGLFVGGVELQRRWTVGHTDVGLSLFAGGGGGAAAPVGGGLMLRPALSVMQDFGAWQAGLSLSKVRFTSGSIDSDQFGVVLAWDGRFRRADATAIGQPMALRDGVRSGVGFDRIVGALGAYELRVRGQPDRRIGLIGARLERRFGAAAAPGDGVDAGGHWGLELATAASGDAAGYMEILGSAGWEIAPLPHAAPALRLGLRAAVGLGGGGAVPTGGGSIGKGAVSMSWQFSPQVAAGAEVGVLKAFDSALRAPTAQAWVAVALEPASTSAPAGASLLRATEWVATVQHHSGVLRSDGSTRSLDLLGLKLNRWLSPNLYLSAQAHTAFAGGAGAYGIGLLGAGVASAAPTRGWQVGVEALLGASGGGGVDTRSGALAQALLWAGFSPDAGSQWRLGVGGLRSLKGALATPIVEASWVWRFGQP